MHMTCRKGPKARHKLRGAFHFGLLQGQGGCNKNRPWSVTQLVSLISLILPWEIPLLTELPGPFWTQRGG